MSESSTNLKNRNDYRAKKPKTQKSLKNEEILIHREQNLFQEDEDILDKLYSEMNSSVSNSIPAHVRSTLTIQNLTLARVEGQTASKFQEFSQMIVCSLEYLICLEGSTSPHLDITSLDIVVLLPQEGSRQTISFLPSWIKVGRE